MNNRLSPRMLYIKKIVGWTGFILWIATLMELPAWPLFSLTCFTCILIYQYLHWWNSFTPGDPSGSVILVGATMNGIALFANGGRMPVLGRTEIYRWWEPLTPQSRLVWLCDIYAKCSIGDIVILTGIIIAVVVWLIRRSKTRSKAEVVA